MIIIGFPNSKELALNISKELKVKYSEITIRKFPDGEFYIKFNIEVKNQDLVLVQTLNEPNETTLSMLFAAYAAKEQGAKKVIAVCPYLAYMRQDKMFNPGEAVTSKSMGKLFSIFDQLITIDPHLHRYKNLNEVYKIKTTKLSANKLIEYYISKNYKNPIIIGPDDESNQWAEIIANKIHDTSAIMHKNRFSSENVKVKLNNTLDFKNKDIIIIDDIISTGHTILEAIKKIKNSKPKSINIIAIHGIFAEPKVYNEIKKYSNTIVTTNTINNKHSKIDVSQLISDSLR